MARPTKPTALKVIEGNRGKRALSNKEPEPDLLNDLTPPEWLSGPARTIWDREAPEQRKNRLLTVLDVAAFGRWCEDQAGYEGTNAALVGMREQHDQETDPELKGKLLARMVNLQNWLSMYCKRLSAADREFGRTPAARTRVHVEPQGDLFGRSAEEKYLA